jgi:hypothetical protein
MRWKAWLAASTCALACFACAEGEDARNFAGSAGTSASGTGAGAGQAGTGGSAGQAGTGGVAGEGGTGATGGTGGTQTGGTGGTQTGGTGGTQTGGTGGSSTGGTGGSSTGGTGGSSTGGTGGTATGGTGGTCVAPVSGPCDTFPQCGCAPTEACDVQSLTTGSTACYTSQNLTLTSACATRGQCIAGASCVFRGCKGFCASNADCPNHGECFQVQYDDGGTGKPSPHYTVCTDQCHPWNPTGTCGSGLACEPWSGLGENPGQSVCALTGAISTTSCSTANPFCAPGWACLGDNTCRKWCRVNTPGDCLSGQTCFGLVDTANPNNQGLFVGTTEIGVCDYP